MGFPCRSAVCGLMSARSALSASSLRGGCRDRRRKILSSSLGNSDSVSDISRLGAEDTDPRREFWFDMVVDETGPSFETFHQILSSSREMNTHGHLFPRVLLLSTAMSAPTAVAPTPTPASNGHGLAPRLSAVSPPTITYQQLDEKCKHWLETRPHVSPAQFHKTRVELARRALCRLVDRMGTELSKNTTKISHIWKLFCFEYVRTTSRVILAHSLEIDVVEVGEGSVGRPIRTRARPPSHLCEK